MFLTSHKAGDTTLQSNILPATITKRKRDVRVNSSIQNNFLGDEIQNKEAMIQFYNREVLYYYGYLGNLTWWQN